MSKLGTKAAFPRPLANATIGNNWYCCEPQDGMSLRCYVATKTMAALLSNQNSFINMRSKAPAEAYALTAKRAVEMADALLVELQEKPADKSQSGIDPGPGYELVPKSDVTGTRLTEISWLEGTVDGKTWRADWAWHWSFQPGPSVSPPQGASGRREILLIHTEPTVMLASFLRTPPNGEALPKSKENLHFLLRGFADIA